MKQNLICGRRPFWFLLAPFFIFVIASTYQSDWQRHTLISVIISLLAYWSTDKLIEPFAAMLKARGLKGIDLNKGKENKIQIPESLGLVTAGVFILAALCCQYLYSEDPSKLLEYSSGLLAVCIMTLLGFVDDVIELKWRYKIFLPFFASLPLIATYRGPTAIMIPQFLKSWIPVGPDNLFDLGIGLYRVYMVLLTVFCSNSINIYAGINGLEVGQTLIMSAAVIFHNLLELVTVETSFNSLDASLNLNRHLSHHLFSLLFSLPFFACSLALWNYNRYPARIFVGDTYTCFAGVYFAVVGILGHFSKTLLWFFMPQIINFVLSVPQLLKLVPCPRHRLPQFDSATGNLVATKNFTLINLTLHVLGPLPEERLTNILLGFQAVSCVLGLILRYTLFKR